jgi:putative cardiolipin synthase
MHFGTEAMQRWLTALFVLLLAGCTMLPPRIAPPASSALADTGNTPLGRIAAASLTQAPGGDSGFRLLPSGEMAFDARLALAAAATRSIDAQYYHIHADTAGAAFLAALRDAAARGVRVRLLVDDYHAGDLYLVLRGLAAFENVEVRLFNPLPERYGTPIRRLLLSLHEYTLVSRRMHNKLFVADNQFAVYGGRNLADEYFTRHGEANFIDLDVLSAGAVVRDLSASFDRYWNSEQAWALEQRLHALERAVKPAERRADFDVQLKEFAGQSPPVPPRDYLGQSTVRAQIAEGRLNLLAGSARVHDDPPDKVSGPVDPNKASRAMRAKLDVIAGAREEVVIVNPYFLPGPVGLRMMREAQQRGTRLLIVTNSLGTTDEPLVHRAYSRYRADMLRAGVQLYEFGPELVLRSNTFGVFGKSTPRLHAKVAGIDRRWLVVGSVNLDFRSALLNTELGVTIDCAPLVQQALGLLRADAFASMYRLQLAQDGSIEWHLRGENGEIQVRRDEPHASLWRDFSLWLQSLLVPEDEL